MSRYGSGMETDPASTACAFDCQRAVPPGPGYASISQLASPTAAWRATLVEVVAVPCLFARRRGDAPHPLRLVHRQRHIADFLKHLIAPGSPRRMRTSASVVRVGTRCTGTSSMERDSSSTSGAASDQLPRSKGQSRRVGFQVRDAGELSTLFAVRHAVSKELPRRARY